MSGLITSMNEDGTLTVDRVEFKDYSSELSVYDANFLRTYRDKEIVYYCEYRAKKEPSLGQFLENKGKEHEEPMILKCAREIAHPHIPFFKKDDIVKVLFNHEITEFTVIRYDAIETEKRNDGYDYYYLKRNDSNNECYIISEEYFLKEPITIYEQ